MSVSDTPPILEVTGLGKTYSIRRGLMRRESFAAVSDVSFRLRHGEVLALVGESGCGKTTIGKSILRLIDADQGSIRFDGKEISHLSQREFRKYRHYLQMVFQDPLSSFNPMISISRAIMEPLMLREDMSLAERRAEVDLLLEKVELDPSFAKLYPRQLSGGQLQRVGIARAIALQPRLIFLDEPTSALDMSVRGQIVNLLLDLQVKHGLCYILVTHDLRLVRKMADRVMVMYNGEVVEEGICDEMFLRPLHPYTKGLLAATKVGGGLGDRSHHNLYIQGETEIDTGHYIGCKLYGRCLSAQERCAKEPQVLREILPARKVRCCRALDL